MDEVYTSSVSYITNDICLYLRFATWKSVPMKAYTTNNAFFRGLYNSVVEEIVCGIVSPLH